MIVLSKVNLGDINFFERYVSVELFGCDTEEEVVGNLRKIYEFIDCVEGGVPWFPMGAAYRKIKKTAREKYGRSKKYIISKRQVKNLIVIHKYKDTKFVKIPFTSDYIFKAIFFILEEYKEDEIDIPPYIEMFRGKLRRFCFYNNQSYSLNRICSVDSPNLMRDLNYDINADKGALGKIF